MISKVAPYYKAIAGFLAPGAVALIYALQDGSVSGPEWLGIVVACLAGSGVVLAAPKNVPKSKAP